jgi:hypothetical protein
MLPASHDCDENAHIVQFDAACDALDVIHDGPTSDIEMDIT